LKTLYEEMDKLFAEKYSKFKEKKNKEEWKVIAICLFAKLIESIFSMDLWTESNRR